MNEETNRFEELTGNLTTTIEKLKSITEDNPFPELLRPNGEVVPKHWSIFTVGENIVVKDYVFKVAYIGETSILFEPVGKLDLSGATEVIKESEK